MTLPFIELCDFHLGMNEKTFQLGDVKTSKREESTHFYFLIRVAVFLQRSRREKIGDLARQPGDIFGKQNNEGEHRGEAGWCEDWTETDQHEGHTAICKTKLSPGLPGTPPFAGWRWQVLRRQIGGRRAALTPGSKKTKKKKNVVQETAVLSLFWNFMFTYLYPSLNFYVIYFYVSFYISYWNDLSISLYICIMKALCVFTLLYWLNLPLSPPFLCFHSTPTAKSR